MQIGKDLAFHSAAGDLVCCLLHFHTTATGMQLEQNARSLHGRMRWGRPYKEGHCTSIYGWNRPYKGARALLQHFDTLQCSLYLLRGPCHLRQVARCSVRACKPSLQSLMTASDKVSLEVCALQCAPCFPPEARHLSNVCESVRFGISSACLRNRPVGLSTSVWASASRFDLVR